MPTSKRIFAESNAPLFAGVAITRIASSSCVPVQMSSDVCMYVCVCVCNVSSSRIHVLRHGKGSGRRKDGTEHVVNRNAPVPNDCIYWPGRRGRRTRSICFRSI